MLSFVFAINPIIEMGGQIAAIVICLFTFLLVVIMVGLHFGLAFGTTWLRDEAELIKLPRPQLDHVNKATEAALEGVKPTDVDNAVVRAAVEAPERVHMADNKVGQVSDRVAGALIEFRARTAQAGTVLKAFVIPPSAKPEEPLGAYEDGLTFKSPGLRKLMEERAPEIPVAPVDGEGYAQAVAVSQLRDASAR